MNAAELVTLDEDVRLRCVEVINRLGLVSGSFDLAVDEAGAVVFMEVNQAGQFLWMEAPGVPVLDFFCHFLAARSKQWTYDLNSPRLELSAVVAGEEYKQIVADAERHAIWPNDEHVQRSRPSIVG